MLSADMVDTHSQCLADNNIYIHTQLTASRLTTVQPNVFSEMLSMKLIRKYYHVFHIILMGPLEFRVNDVNEGLSSYII